MDRNIDRRHRDAARSRNEHQDFEDELDPVDRRHLEAERKKTLDEALDCGLEDTFPGSDPVAVTQPPRSAHDKHRP
jgi:hypothetical protein